MKSRKAGMNGIMTGMIICFIGLLGYIVCHIFLEGTATSTGFLEVATTSLNINASSFVYRIVSTTWKWMFRGVFVAGIVFAIVSQLRREFQEERVGGVF